MASSTPLKRSSLDVLESQPPSKMPKSSSSDSRTFISEQFQQSISEFSPDQREEILLESVINHPPVAARMQTQLTAMKAARLVLPPLRFDIYTPAFQATFDNSQETLDDSQELFETYQKILNVDFEHQVQLNGSIIKSIVGGDIRDIIIREVRSEILAKVERGLCYETKYNALTALVDIGPVVVKTYHEVRSCKSQSGQVPDALIEGMLAIARMMTPDEIQRVVEETDKPTRQFTAARAEEMKDKSQEEKPVVMARSQLTRPRVIVGPMVAVHKEILGFNADKSLIVRILQLRWANNPNKLHRGSWIGLYDVVDIFMGDFKEVPEPWAA